MMSSHKMVKQYLKEGIVYFLVQVFTIIIKLNRLIMQAACDNSRRNDYDFEEIKVAEFLSVIDATSSQVSSHKSK
jgi:hypothetical protein